MSSSCSDVTGTLLTAGWILVVALAVVSLTALLSAWGDE